MKISYGYGGERNDHNFSVFGPILIIFGMEALLAPKLTPNEYFTAAVLDARSCIINDLLSFDCLLCHLLIVCLSV